MPHIYPSIGQPPLGYGKIPCHFIGGWNLLLQIHFITSVVCSYVSMEESNEMGCDRRIR